jgi:hypothetical protein
MTSAPFPLAVSQWIYDNNSWLRTLQVVRVDISKPYVFTHRGAQSLERIKYVGQFTVQPHFIGFSQVRSKFRIYRMATPPLCFPGCGQKLAALFDGMRKLLVEALL